MHNAIIIFTYLAIAYSYMIYNWQITSYLESWITLKTHLRRFYTRMHTRAYKDTNTHTYKHTHLQPAVKTTAFPACSY